MNKQLFVVAATLFILGSAGGNSEKTVISGALAQQAGEGNLSQPVARQFPPPWIIEQFPGGYKVKDAQGLPLAYVYGRGRRADANTLTMDEARGIASNIAKLPNFLASQ